MPEKRQAGFHLADFAETCLNNRLLGLSPDVVIALDLRVVSDPVRVPTDRRVPKSRGGRAQTKGEMQIATGSRPALSCYGERDRVRGSRPGSVLPKGLTTPFLSKVLHGRERKRG